MTDSAIALAELGGILAVQRDAILSDWRARARSDPRLAVGRALTAEQLNDHLTALLENFERRLASDGRGVGAGDEELRRGDAAAHGLHRWQQGFDVFELTRELGRLNECMVEAIQAAGASMGPAGARAADRAGALWAAAHGASLSASAEQFSKLQQAEAAGQIKDLESALAALRALEAQRGELWREAAHDLRGNLSVASVAAAGLAIPNGAARERLLLSLDRNLRSLNSLLADVTSLTRLQGGLERRESAPADASAIMRGLADAAQELAAERGLYLRREGPEALPVEADAVKARRIVQNLLLNALRYTKLGGVTLRWGPEPANSGRQWFAEVADTGPGLDVAPRGPLGGAIEAATAQSARVAAPNDEGAVVHIPASEVPDAPDLAPLASSQAPGEGLGLSIVKRLCSLLDATISVESKPGEGATFRVVFPTRYPAAGD